MKRGFLFSVALGGMLCVAGIASCGPEGTNTTTSNPCPNGLCGTGGAGGDTASSSSSGSGGGNSSSSSGQGGSSSCVEAWLCSPWETNGMNNDGTRTCTDLNNCGTATNKPAETAVLPGLDLDYYKCNVEPILDRGCAQLACHGTETGRALRVYARGRHRHPGEMLLETGCLKPGTMVPSENCEGGIECACWTAPHTATEWQRNFDAARGFALDSKGNPIPAGQEDSSELISQPIVGGKAHAGIKLFASGDADHTTLKNWLSGQKLGMTCNTTN